MKDDGKEKKQNAIRKIPDELRLYIEKRLELLVLDVGEEFSKFAARSFYKIVGIVTLSVALILALFSLSLYLGDLLHNQSLGFLLTSIPIFIIGLMFFMLRPRKMVHKFSDQIFGMVLKSYEDMTQKDKPQELQSKN
ncbi:MAG TPA: hypothetical protein VKA34_11435 [Balneolales bacterium]|nr:hypothetical protein [Balneolales bacterium]